MSESAEQGFEYSKSLLFIILFKKCGINFNDIVKELSKYIKRVDKYINFIKDEINICKIHPSYVDDNYQKYKNIDVLYNESFGTIISNEILGKEIQHKSTFINPTFNIMTEFYEGFGHDIYK